MIAQEKQRPPSRTPVPYGALETETDSPGPVGSPTAPYCTASRISLQLGHYRVRLAETLAEREAAGRLRFRVFNLELGEGLEASYRTGLDQDQFDLFCDHLIVEDLSAPPASAGPVVVGTYRMQSGAMAARNVGYYSAQEFDFAPYEVLRDQALELGRASIDREHRTSEVLTLLWRGIAEYSRIHNLRYLIGCSSLTSSDPQAGWAAYDQLSQSLVAPEYSTRPTPDYALPPAICAPEQVARVPKLLRTYIGVGARICGAPAWDREFGTIDFLTLLDLTRATPAAKVRFHIQS